MIMRFLSHALLALAIAFDAVAATSANDDGIGWFNGDVDKAFAEAKARSKPVFLYWGAVWCPPCNQVKATLFNRQDFIERSRFFVPVYIDGDSPNAQRLGARFNVSAYPTMILFRSDGSEITRLPGEVDGEQYMRVLTLAMNGARPVKSTLADALGKRTRKLNADDWHMLAYYSWDTDDQTLIPKDKLAMTLDRLAAACPADQADVAARLKLRAIVAAATAKDKKNASPKIDVDALLKIVSNDRLVRENFDLVTYSAADVVGYATAPGSPQRKALADRWGKTLDALAHDQRLSTLDRLSAVYGQVALAKLDAPKGPLPDPLLAAVRAEASGADRETKDPYARQAVISAAAEVLTEATLLDDSDKLLNAELARSHSPYYFMLGLAANAKKRGDKKTALDWYEKAYAAAKGDATRLQWGASYVSALIDLSPDDTPRIEKAVQTVIGGLKPTPDTFYDRSRRALERIGKKLAEWNRNGAHRASVARVQTQLNDVCAKLPSTEAARTTCYAALKTAA